MLAILKDAETRPELFQWFGAIDKSEIQAWVQSSHFSVPADLVQFWSQTGGGDLFESETIFRPTPIPSSAPYFTAGDEVALANENRRRDGMPRLYLAFHDGLLLSAVRLSDQTLVTLSKKYKETGQFSDLNEWYSRTLRAEFAKRYDLP
jgi:hypothetical protein